MVRRGLAATTAGAFFFLFSTIVIFFDARTATAARGFLFFVCIAAGGTLGGLLGRCVVIVAKVVVGRGLTRAAECVAVVAEPDTQQVDQQGLERIIPVDFHRDIGVATGVNLLALDVIAVTTTSSYARHAST